MAENRGKQGQQKARHDSISPVACEGISLQQGDGGQRGGSGNIYQICIDRGGDGGPGGPSDQGIHRHGHSGKQGQDIAVQMAAPGAGIRPGDEDASGQGDGNGQNRFGLQLSFEHKAVSQGHPHHLRTHNGRGAGHRGIFERVKPDNKMQRKADPAGNT